MKHQRTIRDLLIEFRGMFTVDQISESEGLQRLNSYLFEQSKRANGNFIHIPNPEICDLLALHMKYDPSMYDRCLSCHWAQTCEFYIKNQQQEIKKCGGFKPLFKK